MSSGEVVQVIGAVVDVVFPREELPKIYDALKIEDRNLTLEVQQQLGDGIVRTIAMGSSEGLSRGLPVSNTGGPIEVPVGSVPLKPGRPSTCRILMASMFSMGLTLSRMIPSRCSTSFMRNELRRLASLRMFSASFNWRFPSASIS